MAVNLFDANSYRAANADLRSFNDAQAWFHFQNSGLNEGRTFSPFVNLNFYRSSNSDLARFSYRQAFDHLQNSGVAEGRRFSDLVDLNFYRAYNSDLASFNNEQLFEHLRSSGINEGRSFSPFVNLNFYRSSNSDLASFSYRQALEHLQNSGVAEGRRFSDLVDLNFYRSYNSDLAGFNNKQIFSHLQNYGINDGRRFSPFVDLNFYRNYNSDLAGFNNKQIFSHLQNYGINDGRRFSPFVDLNFYRVANSDLNAIGLNNRQLLEHLVNNGVAEGHRFSIAFDSSYYRNANLELAAANLNNTQLFQHFQCYGLSEGRASSASFNVGYYLNNNFDLRVAGFNNQRAHEHFETFGFREGRPSAPPLSISTDPGNTLDTATSLDVLRMRDNRSVSGFVGTTDRNDYYRFTLANTSSLNLTLNGLSNYATVELIYDSNGNGVRDYEESLYSTYGSSYSSGAINATLGAGTYFIRVYTDYTNYNTNYTLGISAISTSPTTPRDPGNNLGMALDIGNLTGSSRSFSDFVGTTDRNDYYRFTLANTSNLNLSLNGLSDYATVELIYDSNGNGVRDYDESLYSTYGSSYSSGAINTTLGAGTYFIRVYTDSTYDNTNYNLSLSAIATPPTTSRDPGNSLGTALEIGNLVGRSLIFKDFVGTTDRNDYYRFILDTTSNFNLSLNGLSDYATVELIYDSNGNGVRDYDESLYSTYGSSYSSGAINSRLGAGTYFVRVYTDSTYDNTNYNLSLSA